MNRRNLLKRMTATGLGLASMSLQWPSSSGLFSSAMAAEGKTVVSIFQRGGCDGLNVVVPYGEDEYYNLRPTIGIAAPNINDPGSALDLNGFFGLHPAMQAMLPIYNQGNMAVLPTVQYDSPSHSHFDSQHYIESGVRLKPSDGWLNRYLASHVHAGAGSLRAASFGGETAQSLRGDTLVSSFNDLASFNLGMSIAEETLLRSHLLPVYEQTPNPQTAYRQLVHNSGRVSLNNLDVIAGIDTSNYVPENNAVYPNNTYGRQLKQTAQMIKSGIGLEAVTVNIGGWDTHSGQGGAEGRQANQLKQFSDGIAALYTDLGALMDDVIILSMTEFGRTSKENGSFGTDHGNASSWFMLGNTVQGGIYGNWPGLDVDSLANGRYLQHTVDYRDVMGDILTGHLGANDLATILPGHGYTPLGLV